MDGSLKSPVEQLSAKEETIPSDSPSAPAARVSAWIEDRQFSFYVLLILTVGALYLTYIIFRPFLTALFVALVLTIGLFPLHKLLVKRSRSVTLAALTVTVLALLVIVLPFVVISIKLAGEASATYDFVLQTMRNPGTWPHHLDPLIQEAADQTGVLPDQVKARITDGARELGSWVLRFAAVSARRFVQELTTVLLAAFFLFPLLRSSEEFRHWALSMLPLSPQRLRELGIAVSQGIIADIYGMVAVGLVEGVLVGIGFWLSGLGSPLLWGVVATVLSCLPFVGVSLVWIPACFVLGLRGHLASAIVLAAWCLLIVLTTEGYVRSKVVGGRARINSMLITLSMIGGVVAFGGIGLFAGPVVLVIFATLVNILRDEHAGMRQAGSQVA
jgi:predicted PurR-regulated permease PerM